MNAVEGNAASFYIHTLAVAEDRRLTLLPPRRLLFAAHSDL